jgi:hypothetical protein
MAHNNALFHLALLFTFHSPVASLDSDYLFDPGHFIFELLLK